jgi:hypothetical protein
MILLSSRHYLSLTFIANTLLQSSLYFNLHMSSIVQMSYLIFFLWYGDLSSGLSP